MDQALMAHFYEKTRSKVPNFCFESDTTDAPSSQRLFTLYLTFLGATDSGHLWTSSFTFLSASFTFISAHSAGYLFGLAHVLVVSSSPRAHTFIVCTGPQSSLQLEIIDLVAFEKKNVLKLIVDHPNYRLVQNNLGSTHFPHHGSSSHASLFAGCHRGFLRRPSRLI
jgi:hypothetical protein